MKSTTIILSNLLVLLLAQVASAQIASFTHVVWIVQENRTPDNLFQGLCVPPFGSSSSCSTKPMKFQYDIQTSNWLNKISPTGITQPRPVPLANTFDVEHTHQDFLAMCDKNSSGRCLMDGATAESCTPDPHTTCPPNPQFYYVDNSTGAVNPYLELATQYGWANYMFQSNQGPSLPAHQFIFGATSAPSTADDQAGIFSDQRASVVGDELGCTSPVGTVVSLVEPNGGSGHTYPCFEHDTVPDLLPSMLTWRYYTPLTPGNIIWDAPLSIQHICESSGPGGQCLGAEYLDNVDSTPAHILTDIAKCKLRSVSWVIPAGQNSDHAGNPQGGGGPSWVASIVNSIGTSTTCDGGTGYWKNTAIIITWDDWGGWYDHEPPATLVAPWSDYQRGFRVPLIVVSAYTPARTIVHKGLDFGSIVRFIEVNFSIAEGALNFDDERIKTDLAPFFNLSASPRPFTAIAAAKGASFFINDKTPPTAPDDD